MERLTKEQGAVISAFTGIMACSFSDMHEYIERIMERPVFTHELASKELTAEIKEKARADFLALVAVKD